MPNSNSLRRFYALKKLVEISSTEALSLVSGDEGADVEGKCPRKMSYTPDK